MLNRARIKAGLLYVKRIIFWNSTLPKYLTGDFFAQQCEYVYKPSSFRFVDRLKKDVRRANSIFCESHNLEDFLDEFGDVINAKVLVLGNSDRDFNVNDLHVPLSINRIYVQNLNFVDPRFEILPIGLENMRLGRNTYVRLRRQQSQNGNILAGPFSMTHPERKEISSLNYSELPCTFLVNYISVTEYRRLLSEYQFVLCPRGNGHDTHRFWEVLYSGSTPIVKRSTWTHLLKQKGLPIIEVESWEAEEIQKSISEFTKSADRVFDGVYLSKKYWRDLITS